MVNVYLSGEMGENRRLSGETRKRLAAGLFRHPGTLVLFAETGRKLVGLAVCFVGFSTFHAGKFINIHDLVVLPEYRGQGVAGELLRAVERKAGKIGCCKLTLEVRMDNKIGMTLYKKHGFSGGEYPMYFWIKKLQHENGVIGGRRRYAL